MGLFSKDVFGFEFGILPLSTVHFIHLLFLCVAERKYENPILGWVPGRIFGFKAFAIAILDGWYKKKYGRLFVRLLLSFFHLGLNMYILRASTVFPGPVTSGAREGVCCA